MADIMATRNDSPELIGRKERWVDLGDGTHARKVVAAGASVDDAAFTPGAGLLMPLAALADEISPDSVDEGDLGVPRMTLNRVLRVAPSLHDGTTEGADSQRGNTQGLLLASAARAAAVFSPIQTNVNARGVVLSLQVTAGPGGSETLSLIVRYVDPVTGGNQAPVALMAVPAGTYASPLTYRLVLFPGTNTTSPENSPTYNKGYSIPVPRSWVAQVDHSGSGSWTYSLGFQYLV